MRGLVPVSLLLAAGLPATGQSKTPEPTPYLRVDLRPYGYRTTGVVLDGTQLTFLTDKFLTVTVHQEIPNPNPSKECKRFLAHMGKYATFPDCEYVSLPIETLVFEVETGALHAQGKTKNRSGKTMFPVLGGRFVVQTEQELVLYSNDLHALARYSFVQRTGVSPEVSPGGRRMGLLAAGKLLILDTSTLTLVGSVDGWGQDYAIGDEGVLVRHEEGREDVYSYVPIPGSREQLVYQEAGKGCVPSAWFLGPTRIQIDGCRKKVIVSTLGELLCTEGQPCWKRLSTSAERVIENHGTYKFWTRVRHFPLEDFGKFPPDLRFVRVRDTATGKKIFEIKTDHEPGNPDAVLSSDGLRVALIRNGFLEIFLIPCVTPPVKPSYSAISNSTY